MLVSVAFLAVLKFWQACDLQVIGPENVYMTKSNSGHSPGHVVGSLGPFIELIMSPYLALLMSNHHIE